MTERIMYSDCCGWPVLTEERTLSGDTCSRCGQHCGLATAENAYWLAGDRNAAEYLYLYGPSRRYTVVRVDGEVGEQQDGWPPSATEWTRRVDIEEEERVREA